MRVVLFGADGQMGRVLQELWKERRPEDTLVAVDRGLPLKSLESVEPASVLVDFSQADSLEEVLGYGIRTRTPLVIATTGHDEAGQTAIREAAQSIPIFYSANLSFGMHVLKTMVREATALLGAEADVEIVERHHNRKVDAPSGSALLLLQAVQSAREGLRAVFGRSGTARRGPEEVGVHALRGGTITGEHTVLFAMEGETLEFTHRGESKRLFATGALRAALYMQDQEPGLHTMEDLMKERDQ